MDTGLGKFKRRPKASASAHGGASSVFASRNHCGPTCWYKVNNDAAPKLSTCDGCKKDNAHHVCCNEHLRRRGVYDPTDPVEKGGLGFRAQERHCDDCIDKLLDTDGGSSSSSGGSSSDGSSDSSSDDREAERERKKKEQKRKRKEKQKEKKKKKLKVAGSGRRAVAPWKAAKGGVDKGNIRVVQFACVG